MSAVAAASLTQRRAKPYAHTGRRFPRPFRILSTMSALSADAGSPGAEWMVSLEDVHLKLESAAGEVNILRGLDLHVAAGETVSVIGPSGSGKSTMMMVIAGLERPSSGNIRVAGIDLRGMDEDGLALFRRRYVSIVFQNFHLIPTMTALENVAVPLELEIGRASCRDRGHGP